jgi:hypothetical protein
MGGMSPGGTGLSPAAGALGAALLWYNLAKPSAPSGMSADQQKIWKHNVEQMEEAIRKAKELREEQEHKQRIAKGAEVRNSMDQDDKKRREELQHVFDVFKNFQTIDPFSDFVFYDVPIFRPTGGALITRHLDPDGLAAQAEEWAQELNQANANAFHQWADISTHPGANPSGGGPSDSSGGAPQGQGGGQSEPSQPAGNASPSQTGNPQGQAGDQPMNQAGAGPQQNAATPQNSGAGQLAQPAGNSPQARLGSQSGPTGAGDGSLHYQQGAFGTHEIHGIPGSEPSAPLFDPNAVNLSGRVTDVPHIPGSLPAAGVAERAPGSAIGQVERLAGQQAGQVNLGPKAAINNSETLAHNLGWTTDQLANALRSIGKDDPRALTSLAMVSRLDFPKVLSENGEVIVFMRGRNGDLESGHAVLLLGCELSNTDEALGYYALDSSYEGTARFISAQDLSAMIYEKGLVFHPEPGTRPLLKGNPAGPEHAESVSRILAGSL